MKPIFKILTLAILLAIAGIATTSHAELTEAARKEVIKKLIEAPDTKAARKILKAEFSFPVINFPPGWYYRPVAAEFVQSLTPAEWRKLAKSEGVLEALAEIPIPPSKHEKVYDNLRLISESGGEADRDFVKNYVEGWLRNEETFAKKNLFLHPLKTAMVPVRYSALTPMAFPTAAFAAVTYKAVMDGMPIPAAMALAGVGAVMTGVGIVFGKLMIDGIRHDRAQRAPGVSRERLGSVEKVAKRASEAGLCDFQPLARR